MPHDTTPEIQQKARQFIEAERNGDPRAAMVLLTLTDRTGLSPQESFTRIQALAEGEQ